MLQISRATDYALLFLTALLARPGRRWSVREAAEELGISRRFLANIVHQLARSSIVLTSKGTGGGVQMTKDPRGISLREVVEVFEGPLGLVPCQCAGKSCFQREGCGLHGYWGRFQQSMLDRLSGTSLGELGGKQ